VRLVEIEKESGGTRPLGIPTVADRVARTVVKMVRHREEASRFLAEVRERFARKPETFNVLGFTHACSQTRKGRFTVLRQTMRRKVQAKLREVKTDELLTAPFCAGPIVQP
jgi:citrate synthase